ncbi:MAG TPA: DUF5668 domain-containing protein [Candidatus Aquilonibacter sp.]|nr:DUF5668 domain-containing protein [Candidatus Aquilonibacter sp.]
MPNYRSHKGLVGGLLIVGIGVILLLDQEGIVSAGHVFAVFWPVFFMLLGLEDLVAGYSPKKKAWGAVLFAGGGLFLMDNLGYLHIRLALLWPVVLILLGLWLLIWSEGHPWHHGRVFGPGGPFGHHEPLGPDGPLGPHGPLGPSGPMGPNGPIGRMFGRHPDEPATQNEPAPSSPGEQAQPNAAGSAAPPDPYPGAAGFAGGQGPQNWHEWRRWQKWEARRQRRAWKRQWTGQYWEDPRARASSGGGFDVNQSQFSYSAVLSHVDRNITSKNFKSGTVSAFFGGFEIDLSHAEIEGDEAVILADAFFGGGEIRIPETWHVVIEGSALFGAFMDETRQRPPEGSTPGKRLIIRGTALFGGISIQN